MKKRAYMQGKHMGLRKHKHKQYFNHEFRHAIKNQWLGMVASAIDHQIMYGTGDDPQRIYP